VQVAYKNVQQMGPNMSKGSKIAIVVLIGVAMVVTVIAVWFPGNVY
jgi:hypothetical protein